MFGFLIKKAFFNFWDNLYRMMLINLGFILVLALSLLAIAGINLLPFQNDILKTILFVIIPLLLFHIYSGGVHGMAKDVIDYNKPGFLDFFKYLKMNLVPSIIFGMINALLAVLFVFATMFYIANGHLFFSIPAIAFLFWASVLWLGASQFFFPILLGLDKNIFKALKKMILIFLDNPFFSIGTFLYSLVAVLLSIPTLLILPGFAFLPVIHNSALKLRLLKYDYIEENPGADPRKIPWESLLAEERKKIGKRTVKGFIFPWKD
ncbi:MAG: hypothetical protein JXR70_03380 [Spirochaetales bacterium]|nr:hypothetical protein [Spirochaetales bacterium]